MKKILSIYTRSDGGRWEAWCPELRLTGAGDTIGDALADLKKLGETYASRMPDSDVKQHLEAIGWRMPECEPPTTSDMEARDMSPRESDLRRNGEFSHMEFDLPWLDAVAGECEEPDGLLNNQKGGHTMDTDETMTGTSEAKMTGTSKVKEKLGDIMLAVSWLHVAREYFERPASWLYDRLDGSDGFTVEELLLLKGALTDLARRIIACADSL